MKKVILAFFLSINICFAIESSTNIENTEVQNVENTSFFHYNILYNDSNHLTEERYEDILDFFILNKKLNLYSTYIDIRQHEDYTQLYLNLGNGYIFLKEDWDLEYSIEKNYVMFQKPEEGEEDYHGWDINLFFRNHLHKVNWVSKQWDRSWGFGLSFTDGGSLDFEASDDKYTDLYFNYTQSTTFPSIGMGGTYFSLAGNGGAVFSSVPNDGYRFNIIAFSATNWGYGFRTTNYLNNEIRDYGNYDNAYLIDFVNLNSWTYELGKDFSFSTDIYFQSENFLSGSSRANKIEFNIYPHIRYNKEIKEDLRVFGEFGIKPYSLIKFSNGFDDSGPSLKLKVGLSYRW